MPEMLASHIHNGEFEERVFDVAARLPMNNIGAEKPHQGMPFDVNGFLRRLDAR